MFILKAENEKEIGLRQEGMFILKAKQERNGNEARKKVHTESKTRKKWEDGKKECSH